MEWGCGRVLEELGGNSLDIPDMWWVMALGSDFSRIGGMETRSSRMISL